MYDMVCSYYKYNLKAYRHFLNYFFSLLDKVNTYGLNQFFSLRPRMQRNTVVYKLNYLILAVHCRGDPPKFLCLRKVCFSVFSSR